jgi:DNA-binding PadR family transcriptional regulator
MDPKPHPNHQRYIEALRNMTADQRLRKAFELTELGRRLFSDGLRRLHAGLPESELRRLYLEHLAKCHNKTY